MDQATLIAEQFKTLPISLQRAIDAVPWKNLVQTVGKGAALDAEQIATLERETMFIIYAFQEPDDYIENLARELGSSEEEAGAIADSVADKIFTPLIEKKEAFEKEAPKPEVEPEVSKTAVPEVPPANLPVIEPGEVAHQVPHVEVPLPPLAPPKSASAVSTPPPTPTLAEEPQPQVTKREEIPTPSASVPDYRYPGGTDPYREPLS